jgi:ParB-like chromosome segregation protein Spo0J
MPKPPRKPKKVETPAPKPTGTFPGRQKPSKGILPTLCPAVRCAHGGMVAIGDLRANPKNPNRHSDAQIALLARNIAALGWRHPVLVSKRSGLIVAGHARLQAAQGLGLEQVPVDYQDFASEAEELAYLLADNRLAELAELDNVAIKNLLEELDTGAQDMLLTGFTAEAIEELMTQVHQDDADPNPVESNEVIVCPKCGHEFSIV